MKQLASKAAQDPLYVRVIAATAALFIGVPLLVGIYESWRKKQITTTYIQGYSHSLNPLTLYLMGVRELRSPHWSSSLEKLSKNRIAFDRLPKYQLSLIASRTDIMDQVHPYTLLCFYRNIPTSQKDWVEGLSSQSLLNLLNESVFTPDEEFGTFDLKAIAPSDANRIPTSKLSTQQVDALVSRPEIVHSMNARLHSDLYKKTPKKKEFIAALTAHELVGLLREASFTPDAEFGTFDLGVIDSSQAKSIPINKLSTQQVDALAGRPDIVHSLEVQQHFDIYKRTTKKKEFIACLTGPELVGLLNHRPFTPDAEFGAFDLGALDSSQADSIPIAKLSNQQVDALAGRPDIVHSLEVQQHFDVYKRTTKKKEFIATLTGLELVGLLNHRLFPPDAEFSTFDLGAIDSPQANSIPITKLSNQQVDALLVRVEILNALSPSKLFNFYKDTNRKKEFVAVLPVRQLQALLNYEYFYLDEKFVADFESALDSRTTGIRLRPSRLRAMSSEEAFEVDLTRLTRYQLNILAGRPEVLAPHQLLHLYEKRALEDGEFVTKLSVPQLLGVITDKSFQPRNGFYDLLATRADFIAGLNPDQLAYQYGQISDERKFIRGLKSPQLLALLNHSSIDAKKEIAIFDILLPDQLGQVEVFGQFCTFSSSRLCVLFSQLKTLSTEPFISIPLCNAKLNEFISEIRAKIDSIPASQAALFLSAMPLNQFTLLFFSDHHISSIDFRTVKFLNITSIDLGAYSQTPVNETTPKSWLQNVCRLFDPFLIDEFNIDQLLIRIPQAKTKLQNLSAKQVAFLDRRTDGMPYKVRVFNSLFSDQLQDPSYDDYKLQFDDAGTVVVIPRLSLKDSYEILELPEGASWDQIKAKYRKKALALHPDKTGDDAQAKERFQKVNEAYAFLDSIKNPNASKARS